MPFWMQTEDPEYYNEGPYDPEQPYEDGDDEWEDQGNVMTDDVYYGA